MPHGRSERKRKWMRRLVCGVVFAALALAWSPVRAEPDPKAKKPAPAEITQTLKAVVEAQRSLAVELGQLREQMKELERSINEARDDNRQDRDAVQAVQEQIKGMREEVRGLYVESSGLKGDIAQLGKQVDGVDDSLGSFRLSAGIVVAVVIVLQVVLVGLTFRSRG